MAIRTIATLLVCLFFVNDLSWAVPQRDLSEHSTLAPQLRLKPFFEAHQLDFKNIFSVYCVAGALRNLAMAREVRDSDIVKLNRLFANGAIAIEKDTGKDRFIETFSLESTGRVCKYVILNFKREDVWIKVLFPENPGTLEEREFLELGIKTKEDREFFAGGGLQGVWFAGPERTQSAVPSDPELKERIAARIRENGGRITFEEFQRMAALEGYYEAGRARFGETGNDGVTFLTDVSWTVAYAFARQFYAFWNEMGRPETFQIIEQGGGDGSMALYLLDAIREDPEMEGFYDHVRYTILDISPEWSERQKKLVRERHPGVECTAGSVFDMPFDTKSIEGVLFSNELPDAFPVHRVVTRNGTLKEIYVACDGNEFREEEGGLSTNEIHRYFELAGSIPPEGKEFAVNLCLSRWMREVHRVLKRGFVVTSDYGFDRTSVRYGSRNPAAVWNLTQAPKLPLLTPGIDITHNVDFETLDKIAVSTGLAHEHIGPFQTFLSLWSPVAKTVNLEEYVLVHSKGMKSPEPAAQASERMITTLMSRAERVTRSGEVFNAFCGTFKDAYATVESLGRATGHSEAALGEELKILEAAGIVIAEKSETPFTYRLSDIRNLSPPAKDAIDRLLRRYTGPFSALSQETIRAARSALSLVAFNEVLSPFNLFLDSGLVIEINNRLAGTPGVSDEELTERISGLTGVKKVTIDTEEIRIYTGGHMIRFHRDAKVALEYMGLRDRISYGGTTLKIYEGDFLAHPRGRYTLGVSGTWHDAAAVLLKDGRLVSAIEEERISRTKHDPSLFPMNAIEELLKNEGITLEDIQDIAVGWNFNLYVDTPHSRSPDDEFFEGMDHRYAKRKGIGEDKVVRRRVPEKNKARFDVQKAADLVSALQKRYGTEYAPAVTFVRHHVAHAAAGYYPSGFDGPVVVFTVDGYGDYDSGTVWKADRGTMEELACFELPDTIGLFYETMTEYLGFKPSSGEGEVMGLAAYGAPADEIERVRVARLRDILREFIRFDAQNGNLMLDPEFTYYGERIPGTIRLTKYLCDKLGPYVGRNTGSTQMLNPLSPEGRPYANLAFVLQEVSEELTVQMVRRYLLDDPRTAGIKRVALNGGFFLNILANRRLISEGLVKSDDLFVQPAASDSGVALGAALEVASRLRGQDVMFEMRHANYGTEYSDDEIKAALDAYGLVEGEDYDRLSDDEIITRAAQRIYRNEGILWFQGKCEFGPRALGSRSALWSLRNRSSANLAKERQPWRPSASSVALEYAQDYFVDMGKRGAPFMIVAYDVLPDKDPLLVDGVHPSGERLARPQTVDRESNPLYWRLLGRVGDFTGIPGVVNTSFNRKEPLVEDPEEAINCYKYMDGVTALYIGHFEVRTKDRIKPKIVSLYDEPGLKGLLARAVDTGEFNDVDALFKAVLERYPASHRISVVFDCGIYGSKTVSLPICKELFEGPARKLLLRYTASIVHAYSTAYQARRIFIGSDSAKMDGVVYNLLRATLVENPAGEFGRMAKFSNSSGSVDILPLRELGKSQLKDNGTKYPVTPPAKSRQEGVYIGVDVGASRVKCVVMENGKVIKKTVVKTAHASGEELKGLVVNTVERAAGKRKVSGVGISMPGVVDARSNRVEWLVNYEYRWQGEIKGRSMDFSRHYHALNGMIAEFQEAYGTAVMSNDSNAFAVASLDAGDGPDGVVVILGAGVGVSRLENGAVDMGRIEQADSFAINLKEDALFDQGAQVRGCFAAYAGAASPLDNEGRARAIVSWIKMMHGMKGDTKFIFSGGLAAGNDGMQLIDTVRKFISEDNDMTKAGIIVSPSKRDPRYGGAIGAALFANATNVRRTRSGDAQFEDRADEVSPSPEREPQLSVPAAEKMDLSRAAQREAFLVSLRSVGLAVTFIILTVTGGIFREMYGGQTGLIAEILSGSAIDIPVPILFTGLLELNNNLQENTLLKKALSRIGLAPGRSAAKLAGLSLGISVGAEIALPVIYKLPFFPGVLTRIGGATFSWSDIAAYIIGAGIVYLFYKFLPGNAGKTAKGAVADVMHSSSPDAARLTDEEARRTAAGDAEVGGGETLKTYVVDAQTGKPVEAVIRETGLGHSVLEADGMKEGYVQYAIRSYPGAMDLHVDKLETEAHNRVKAGKQRMYKGVGLRLVQAVVLLSLESDVTRGAVSLASHEYNTEAQAFYGSLAYANFENGCGLRPVPKDPKSGVIRWYLETKDARGFVENIEAMVGARKVKDKAGSVQADGTAPTGPSPGTLSLRQSKVGAAVAIMLLPIALIVVLAAAPFVTLSSKGPVLFTQERVGYQGKSIKIWKLRTFTNEDDPEMRRVTWFGRLIRRTGLDETPQIISIIKGDMQWFGPRPYLRNVVDQNYIDKVLSKTKPGIFSTSALIRGIGDRENLPASETLDYDLKDIEKSSFVYNCMFLLRTILVIVTGKKAGAAAPSLVAPARLSVSEAKGALGGVPIVAVPDAPPSPSPDTSRPIDEEPRRTVVGEVAFGDREKLEKIRRIYASLNIARFGEEVPMMMSGSKIYGPTDIGLIYEVYREIGLDNNHSIVDLGMGDGRWVTIGRALFGARGRGADLIPEVCNLAYDCAEALVREGILLKEDIGSAVRLEEKDLFTESIDDASVIVYSKGSAINIHARVEDMILAKAMPGTTVLLYGAEPGEEGFERLHYKKTFQSEGGFVAIYSVPLHSGDAGNGPQGAAPGDDRRTKSGSSEIVYTNDSHERSGHGGEAPFHVVRGLIKEALLANKTFIHETLKGAGIPEPETFAAFKRAEVTFLGLGQHSKVYKIALSSQQNDIAEFVMVIGFRSCRRERKEAEEDVRDGLLPRLVKNEFINLGRIHKKFPENAAEPYAYTEQSAAGIEAYPVYSMKFIPGYDGFRLYHVNGELQAASRVIAPQLWRMRGEELRKILKDIFKLRIKLFFEFREHFIFSIFASDLMYPTQEGAKAIGPNASIEGFAYRTIAYDASRPLVLTSALASRACDEAFLTFALIGEGQVMEIGQFNQSATICIPPGSALRALTDAMEELFPGEGRRKAAEWLAACVTEYGGQIPGGMKSIMQRSIQELHRDGTGRATKSGMMAQATAEAERIHAATLKYLPAISEKTILCHITADSILPEAQKRSGVLNRLDIAMRDESYAEKIIELNVDESKDFVQQVQDKMREVKAYYEAEYGDEYKNYTFVFDVACPDTDTVARVQSALGVPALAFSRTEGDVVQIEGILLALRALHATGNSLEALSAAFEILTGSRPDLTGIVDVNDFAVKITFILPAAASIDYDEEKRLNKLIEDYIKTAA